jgi:hypothetical protein
MTFSKLHNTQQDTIMAQWTDAMWQAEKQGFFDSAEYIQHCIDDLI